MKDLLEQRHKEFEEKALQLIRTHDVLLINGIDVGHDDWPEIRDNLLSFHDQSLIMLLEKVREEVEKKYKGENLEHDGRKYHLTNGPRETAHNLAITEVSSLLTSSIESIKSNEN